MKKVTLSACVLGFLALAGSGLYAAVYEASTLHNAVARSETVQDLFFKRWEIIQEKELYIDFYGKLNWVPGFQINTYNKGKDELEPVDMRLVRTYGSITINYPILGGYSKDDMEERKKRGIDYNKVEPKEGEEKEKGSGPMGLVKPKNLIVGFTATGFHYGLTRATDVNRGDANDDTVTDYKYSQFFDDIFAASLLYRPYFFIHAGVIVNNQIEPNEDGTMDYGNSSNMKTRYFVCSNLLSFLNMTATTTSSEPEAIAVGVQVTNLLGNFLKLSPLVPKATITYKQLNLFNDMEYDAVWVKTNKTGLLSADELNDKTRDNAVLYTMSLLLEENIFNFLYINIYVEGQKAFDTLYEKRIIHEKGLENDPKPAGARVELGTLREVEVSLGVNFMPKNKASNLILTIGGSRYWDLGIPIHREHPEDGYVLLGGFVALEWQSAYWGAEIRASYNDAQEIRKLVETSDKAMLEASIYGRY